MFSRLWQIPARPQIRRSIYFFPGLLPRRKPQSVRRKLFTQRDFLLWVGKKTCFSFYNFFVTGWNHEWNSWGEMGRIWRFSDEVFCRELLGWWRAMFGFLSRVLHFYLLYLDCIFLCTVFITSLCLYIYIHKNLYVFIYLYIYNFTMWCYSLESFFLECVLILVISERVVNFTVLRSYKPRF